MTAAAGTLTAAAGTLTAAAGTLAAGSDEIMVREVGSKLFSFIFQRGVLDLYNECYANYRKLDEPLSIRLHVKHPGLSYVPWETLYDKTNGFYVTASQQTPFMRAVDDDDDDSARAGSRPVRVLAMAARAKLLNGIPAGFDRCGCRAGGHQESVRRPRRRQEDKAVLDNIGTSPRP